MGKRKAPAPAVAPAPQQWGILIGVFVWLAGSAAYYGSQRIIGPIRDMSRLLSAEPDFAIRAEKVFALSFTAALLILLCVAFARAGRKIAQQAGLLEADPIDELLLGFGLTLGGYSLAVLLLGLLGQITMLSICISLTPILFAALLPQTKITFGGSGTRPGFAESLIFSTIAILVVAYAIQAASPPIFYDSLVYHLALPQIYSSSHTISGLAHNVYSGIPQSFEMLSTAAMAVQAEQLCGLIGWAISLALVALIFQWASREFGRTAGTVAALLFYSCPMVALSIWFGNVEIMWCLYSTLGLYCLRRWFQTSGAGWLWFCGIFAGFACGTKYNALALPVIIAVLLAVQPGASPRKPGATIIRSQLLVCILAALLLAPWLIKNWILVGNPLFPLFDEFFAEPLRVNWKGLLADAHSRSISDLLTLRGLAFTFLDLWPPTPEETVTNVIGFACLGLLPLSAVSAYRGNAVARFLISALLVSWMFWALMSRMPRFFLFALPLLAIAIAAGLSTFTKDRREAALLVGVMILCIPNLALIVKNGLELGGWRVAIGNQDEADYLTRGHAAYFTPYYAAADFVNKSLPATSRLVFVGESRGYYFEREFLAASLFAQNPFVNWINSADSVENLLKTLKENRITHIFVNRAEIFRRDGGKTPFSEQGTKLFTAFSSAHLKKVFQHVVTSPPASMEDRQWVEVYEIAWSSNHLIDRPAAR